MYTCDTLYNIYYMTIVFYYHNYYRKQLSLSNLFRRYLLDLNSSSSDLRTIQCYYSPDVHKVLLNLFFTTLLCSECGFTTYMSSSTSPVVRALCRIKLLPVTHDLVNTWMLIVKPVYKLLNVSHDLKWTTNTHVTAFSLTFKAYLTICMVLEDFFKIFFCSFIFLPVHNPSTIFLPVHIRFYPSK